MMVNCAVYGCKSRSRKSYNSCQIRYFKFPAINSKVDEELHDLVLERRSLWISRIARKDLTLYDGSKISHSKVCSKHFIKGAPSVLRDTSNPDWAPSLNLGHDYFENDDGDMKRFYKDLDSVTEDFSSSIQDDDSVSEEEEEDQNEVHTHKELSVVDGSVKVEEENMMSHNSNEDGHDRLKYFIFSGPNSKKTCNVSHDEAFKAAETLLHYMENQENVDHADLILIRGYRRKILENMKLAE